MGGINTSRLWRNEFGWNYLHETKNIIAYIGKNLGYWLQWGYFANKWRFMNNDSRFIKFILTRDSHLINKLIKWNKNTRWKFVGRYWQVENHYGNNTQLNWYQIDCEREHCHIIHTKSYSKEKKSICLRYKWKKKSKNKNKCIDRWSYTFP